MTIQLNTLYTWHRPGSPLQQIMPVAFDDGKVTLAVVTIYEGYNGGALEILRKFLRVADQIERVIR